MTWSGWKESGGFAGTFSPNAAYVQATAPVTAGTTYTAFVVWKANKAMPAGDTIAAGAGSGPTFSPTRLTVALPDGSNVESDAWSTQQYSQHGSDGSTWNYVDPTALKLTLSPGSSVNTVLSANADLWTFDAGFNQDIGICVVAGASLPAGSCPAADVVVWKESGGYAGTLSPNAAFAQTVMPMTAGTYSVALVWKANKLMPGADTIVIGAGSSPTFSPTRLTALQYPVALCWLARGSRPRNRWTSALKPTQVLGWWHLMSPRTPRLPFSRTRRPCPKMSDRRLFDRRTSRASRNDPRASRQAILAR